MQFSLSTYLKSHYIAASATAFVLLAGPSLRACSICGCSLSSDWALQGYNAMQSEVTGRFEYYDQVQLRSGTHAVDRAMIGLPNDREIQQQTLNRGYWAGIDYVLSPRWGVSAELPYYNRFHTTIAEGDTEISTSRGSGLGDLRLLGRYQIHNPDRGFSLQFGLKLPTGRTDQTFVSGPQAGEPLDRGLQFGSGSTDVLLGAAYFARIAPAWDVFAQILLDQPVLRRDDFRPSTALNANLGIRWLNTSRVTPQLQLNARWDGREHGANADFENSGDAVVDLSPGLTVEVTPATNAFFFLQLPIYQRVNGFQIAPHWLVSTGFRWRR